MSDNDDDFVTPDDPEKADPMLVICGIAVGVMVVIFLLCEVFDVSLWPWGFEH